MPAALAAPPRQPPTVTTTTLIDPEHDDLVPVRTIAKQRLGKTISPSCQWRWVRQSVRGHRLEAVQVMGVWYTTPAAFAAFIVGQTKNALGDDAREEPTAPRSAATTARLRKAGLVK